MERSVHSKNAKDSFGSPYCTWNVSMFALHINDIIGMNYRLFAITGIPLPFIMLEAVLS
jgi:cell division protein FtsW (lipid II flippase)